MFKLTNDSLAFKLTNDSLAFVVLLVQHCQTAFSLCRVKTSSRCLLTFDPNYAQEATRYVGAGAGRSGSASPQYRRKPPKSFLTSHLPTRNCFIGVNELDDVKCKIVMDHK